MELPPPSYQVVERVAREEGVSTTDLSRPLFEVVDAEALDTLYDGGPVADARPIRVSFEYLGYDVHVVGTGRADLTVRVVPAMEPPAEKTGIDPDEQTS
ncbi:MAG: HalOD1 output domain-containing protein [Halorientalis sp.]